MLSDELFFKRNPYRQYRVREPFLSELKREPFFHEPLPSWMHPARPVVLVMHEDYDQQQPATDTRMFVSVDNFLGGDAEDDAWLKAIWDRLE